jgi:hypothetical protein
MRRFTNFALLLAALGLCAAALAASTPDFSGTWVLNNQKGKNLGMVAAVQETVVIVQTPAKLTASFSSTFNQQTTQRTVTYDLTGKPVPNEGAMGEKAETVAKWDGDRLVVTWTAEGAIAGTKSVRTETRSLAEGGRTMIVVSGRPNREPMELVYEKK